MDRELIRAWLQLPPGNWPPDHYTLLALEPSEADLARIEQQVHERMQRLRSYQLTHPELATEAMNRLAQALVCLTDPEAKKAYDAALFATQAPEENSSSLPAFVAASEPSPPSPAPSLSPAPASTPAPGPVDWFNRLTEAPKKSSEEAAASHTEDQKFFDWQTAPPPPRHPAGAAWPTVLEVLNGETTDNSVFSGLGEADSAVNASPVESETAETQAVQLPNFTRRGLRSKGALYYHIARTRQLLWAWEQVGKYLNQPTRFVSRPAEATDLIHHMQVLRELLQTATPLLGEAGQPGYLVLALARQQMIVPTLQTLLPSQREALARDWQAGHALLSSRRRFLRQELRVFRRRSRWKHVIRLLGTGLRDHPGTVLLLLAWITVNLASPQILARWPEQLICLLALAGLRLAFWLYSFRPLRIPALPRSARKVPMSGKRRQPDSSRA